MPNKAAGRKALRQTKRHVVQNTLRRDSFKLAVKNVLKAKTSAEAKKLIVIAQKALDKAAKIGVLKRNTASRRLSRLMVRINKLDIKK
jgi:small subunit ribosomal protein S20